MNRERLENVIDAEDRTVRYLVVRIFRDIYRMKWAGLLEHINST